MEAPEISKSDTAEEANGYGLLPGDRKHRSSSSSSEIPPRPAPVGSCAVAFSFWARLCFLVSVVTVLVASLYSLRPRDERSWFLGLPGDLRSHYSMGRMIKAQLSPEDPKVEIFTVESGPRGGETALLLHGLGCSSYSFREVLKSLGAHGLRAVAVDLPGAGFSDKLVQRRGETREGALGWAWELYSDIREKGLFWGFDQLIETGQIPYENLKTRVPAKKMKNTDEESPFQSQTISRIIAQVINSLELAPVHLVLHDSALRAGASLAMANPEFISSITLVDSSPESAAFPSWIMGTPLLRELLLRSNLVFSGLLKVCCSRTMDAAAAEAHMRLLNSNNGRRAVVETGRVLNFSFGVGDWAASMAPVPTQVLWSGSWSDRWIDEGRRVAGALPAAKFFYHSGGRWPQEGAAAEIAARIAEFISSLPASFRPPAEELTSQSTRMRSDEDSGPGFDHFADDVSNLPGPHGWGF